MAGDTANVNVWSGADVLLGSLTATVPTAGAAFTMNATPGTGTNWDFVGILDGGAGFSESQSNDSTDFPGWGVGTVATTRKNLAITRTFTVMEDNLVTLGIRYDVSGITVAGAGYSGTLKGRDLAEKFKIAFETRAGTAIKRLISKNYAMIESIGDATEGEDNVSSFPVTVKIYPSSAGEFWTTYKA
jgi:hypothetical protein